MNIIIYDGKKYNAETIESYYGNEIALAVEDEYRDTKQDFFDRYIQLDPDFVDLFKYDFYSID